METSSERPDDLVNPTRAAAVIGVHLSTIYRWMDDGTLPFWVVGKRQRKVRLANVLDMVRPGRAARPRDRPHGPRGWERTAQQQATRGVLDRYGLA